MRAVCTSIAEPTNTNDRRLLSMSELLFATRKIVERTGDVLPFYIAAAAIYFVICFTISRLGVLVAQRYRFGVAR